MMAGSVVTTLAGADPVPRASALLSRRPACRKREGMRQLAILPALLVLGAGEPLLVDSTVSATSWRAASSDEVAASSRAIAGPEGRAVELSYDFDGVNGYAFIRRRVDIALPSNFEVRFRIRGHGGRNDFQFKLTDGENVWWKVWRNQRPSADWQDVVIPAGDITFAWGPASDHRLRRADGIELVVARDRDGGAGAIAISNLRIIPLPGEPTATIASDDRRNLALEALAKTAQRGAYPRSFIGEQLYWTLAGSDDMELPP